jgi:CsoR family transcriptional regulator, copper-sensing transcriptional repressor
MAGYYENKEALIKRLRLIEGQVRGLQRLVESDSYCIDIMTQVTAVTAGLNKVAVALLEDHLGHCVADSIASGEGAEDKVREAAAAVQRLLKA